MTKPTDTRAALARRKEQNTFTAIVALSVLIGGAGIYFVAVPEFTKTTALRSSNDALEAELERQRALVEQLDTLQAQNADLKTRLAAFNLRFPKAERLSVLLSSMGALAQRNNMAMASLERRMEASEIQGVDHMKLTLDLRGTYPDLRAFARAVENDARFMSIDSMNFTVGNGADINATVAVSTYLLRDQNVGVVSPGADIAVQGDTVNRNPDRSPLGMPPGTDTPAPPTGPDATTPPTGDPK